MPDYRRFIAYFYEYIDGKRQRNAGFVKAEQRNGIWKLNLQLRSGRWPEGNLKIFGYIGEGEHYPVLLLGRGFPQNGSLIQKLQFRSEQVELNGRRFENLSGMWIPCGEKRCFLSHWDEGEAETKFLFLPEETDDKVQEGSEEKTQRERVQENEEVRPQETAVWESEAVKPQETAVRESEEIKPQEAAVWESEEAKAQRTAVRESEEAEAQRATMQENAEVRLQRAAVQENAGVGLQTAAVRKEEIRKNAENVAGERKRVTEAQRMAGLEEAESPGEAGELEAENPGEAEVLEVESPGEAGKLEAESPGEAGKLEAESPGKPEEPEAEGPGEAGESGMKSPEEAGKLVAENMEEIGKFETEKSDETGKFMTEASEEPKEVTMERNVSGVKDRTGGNVYSEEVDTWISPEMMKKTEAGQQRSFPDGLRGGMEERLNMQQENTWQMLRKRSAPLSVFPDQEFSECIRICPRDILWLRQRQWPVGRNSFLMQGFQRYRHLLLARRRDGTYVLGVPGAESGQNQYVALAFGFPEFKQARASAAFPEGFGYWCRTIIF